MDSPSKRIKMTANRPLAASPYPETTSTTYSTILQTAPTESFLFDTVLLQHYGVALHEAETLANMIQNMYMHGSHMIQTGLTYMTNGMIHILHDMNSMRQENTSLRERNALLEVAHNDNAFKLDKVEDITSKLAFAKNSTIPTLQAEIDRWQEKYDALVETVSEMEKSSSQADTLKSELDVLKIRFSDLDKRLTSTQTKFADASTKLNACLHLFKDFGEPKKHSFPVSQANGVMVEFTKVVAAWAKSAGDGENHPSRNYICPATNAPTTLAHLGVSSRFQEIATAVGLSIEPPICFEYQDQDNKWTPFSFKHQFHLVAHMCFVYANRKSIHPITCVALDDGAVIVQFKLDKANPQHTLTVHRQDNGPTRIRINQPAWDPFPRIAIKASD